MEPESELDVGQTSAGLNGEWDLNASAFHNEVWDGSGSSSAVWKTMRCVDVNGDEHLISRLRGFREPSSNLDNFVARLDVGCRQYEGALGGYFPIDELPIQTVYAASNFRTPGTLVDVPTSLNHVAVGLRLKLNPGSDYVKDIQLMRAILQPNGTVGSAIQDGWVTGYGGNNIVDLTCPTNQVMTGISVRETTSNGKIRHLIVRCRLLRRV